MKIRLPLLLVLSGFWLTLLNGCAMLLEDAAMAPYDKALRNGRMTPAEHMRQHDEVLRATGGR